MSFEEQWAPTCLASETAAALALWERGQRELAHTLAYLGQPEVVSSRPHAVRPHMLIRSSHRSRPRSRGSETE